MATKVYDFSGISPISIFNDMTYLGHDEETAKQVRRQCMTDGYIPVIEFDPELGWVFHTLFTPDNLVSKKEIAAHFEASDSTRRSEAEMEAQLAEQLAAQGHRVQRQAPCAAGKADLVTEQAVYELKLHLSVYNTWLAVGQVLIYRQAFGEHLQAVIVGGYASEAERVYPYVRELGIQLIFWKEE